MYRSNENYTGATNFGAKIYLDYTLYPLPHMLANTYIYYCIVRGLHLRFTNIYSSTIIQREMFAVLVYLMCGEQLISWISRICSHELLKPSATRQEKSTDVSFISPVMFGLVLIRSVLMTIYVIEASFSTIILFCAKFAKMLIIYINSRHFGPVAFISARLI